MNAYHGDSSIKAEYVRRVDAHRKADELHQGVGFEKNGKTRGCAVGCTLDAYDHERYPVELGVPLELAHLEDCIFEGLPSQNAMDWPGEFLKAIPVGADLSGVWPQFAIWILTDPKHGVRRFTQDGPDQQKAVDTVAALYRERVAVRDPRWTAARAAAWAAEAWAAAGEGAAAAVVEAARAAGRAAAAVEAAAPRAAAAAARHKFWIGAAHELIRLLAAAPVRK